MKTRINVIERNSGKIEYVPQVFVTKYMIVAIVLKFLCIITLDFKTPIFWVDLTIYMGGTKRDMWSHSIEYGDIIASHEYNKNTLPNIELAKLHIEKYLERIQLIKTKRKEYYEKERSEKINIYNQKIKKIKAIKYP